MEHLVLVLSLSIAGGVGAGCRFVLDGIIKSRTIIAFPIGTMIVNIAGSFLLGLITGFAISHSMPEAWRTILGVGFCGGFTTFSTASFETVRLAQQRRFSAAALNAFGMLLGSLLAAGLGVWLGSLSI
ncbi:MAG: fluoride efflux transporter CrcB [Microbacteriaceae bacterium]|nr:fluoride efflux transporter CrcB [Cryobacterium sp.]MCC6376504.1 fluoride efflux transporter CrcB [Microbacteriaceae bacterium]